MRDQRRRMHRRAMAPRASGAELILSDGEGLALGVARERGGRHRPRVVVRAEGAASRALCAGGPPVFVTPLARRLDRKRVSGGWVPESLLEALAEIYSRRTT